MIPEAEIRAKKKNPTAHPRTMVAAPIATTSSVRLKPEARRTIFCEPILQPLMTTVRSAVCGTVALSLVGWDFIT